MKVAIYHGQNEVHVEERPIPSVGPKDVLIEICVVEFVEQILILLNRVRKWAYASVLSLVMNYSAK